MAFAGLERTNLIKDDERYGCLSSLWPAFVIKVVDILNSTVRLLTDRSISADLHTFTFTLRERLRTHKVFTKGHCFNLNYHKFSIKSYVFGVY